ncbi:unnamed protein product [Phaeothamnion confervicola]
MCVMWGAFGVFFAVWWLQGSTRDILHKFSVELPKKHGRGGQSALRFARLRLEKRHNYIRKVAELAVTMFITDNKCNCRGLILAGSAEFKNELMTSDLFDPRLRKAVIKTVDVSYGGEAGFNQAIELSAEALGQVKLIREKRLLQQASAQYFEEISQDTGEYCFMVDDTLKALELGAVETLICWDNLNIDRLQLRNNATGAEKVLHLRPEQEANESLFRDADTGTELETIEKQPLVEWIANNYKRFGCTLEFVTDRSQEGSQFCRGFGGIGGLLRWRVDFAGMDESNHDAAGGEGGSEDEWEGF